MMTTPTSADAEEIAADRPRMTRGGRLWTTLGLTLSVGVAVWLGLQAADQPVRWRDVGFAIVSPTQAEATFDVFLYGEDGATCRVRALNNRHAEVGAVDVPIDRAAGKEQRITASVVTVERATTAVLAYCTSP